jgi:hypothetical protein
MCNLELDAIGLQQPPPGRARNGVIRVEADAAVGPSAAIVDGRIFEGRDSGIQRQVEAAD